MRQTDLFDLPQGPSSRYEELELAATEFNGKHPEVWKLFVQFTRDAIACGFDCYSADAVMHRVRWETAMGQSGPYGEAGRYKINDHHVTFYGRWFMEKNPERDGFFRLRIQKSKVQQPTGRRPDHPLDA